MALVLLVSAYSNSFHNAFHFDDNHVIETNLYIRSLTNTRVFFTDARTFSSLPANAVYRPLVTVSLALDYWLGGGLVPWQFHVSQFVMLLLLSVTLFFFFLRIVDIAEAHWWNRYVALLSTIWFAVHTVNTETVNYISARSELLSAHGCGGRVSPLSLLSPSAAEVSLHAADARWRPRQISLGHVRAALSWCMSCCLRNICHCLISSRRAPGGLCVLRSGSVCLCVLWEARCSCLWKP